MKAHTDTHTDTHTHIHTHIHTHTQMHVYTYITESYINIGTHIYMYKHLLLAFCLRTRGKEEGNDLRILPAMELLPTLQARIVIICKAYSSVSSMLDSRTLLRTDVCWWTRVSISTASCCSRTSIACTRRTMKQTTDQTEVITYSSTQAKYFHGYCSIKKEGLLLKYYSHVHITVSKIGLSVSWNKYQFEFTKSL